MKLVFNFNQTPGPGSRDVISGAGSILLLSLLALTGAACAGKPPSVREAGDGSDPQRLVALVDYIGGDYGGAVGPDGAVLDAGVEIGRASCRERVYDDV